MDLRSAERSGLIEEAARAYEEAMRGGETTIDALLNLAVLYWQATDPGMASAAVPLSAGFFERAARRCPDLLAEASDRYPGSAEVRFWTRYIAWAERGEVLGPESCRQWLREEPEVLEPAMHLFALTDGVEGRPEAERLLRRSREAGTFRGRYVASVIEAVLKRLEFRKHRG